MGEASPCFSCSPYLTCNTLPVHFHILIEMSVCCLLCIHESQVVRDYTVEQQACYASEQLITYIIIVKGIYYKKDKGKGKELIIATHMLQQSGSTNFFKYLTFSG